MRGRQEAKMRGFLALTKFGDHEGGAVRSTFTTNARLAGLLSINLTTRLLIHSICEEQRVKSKRRTRASRQLVMLTTELGPR